MSTPQIVVVDLGSQYTFNIDRVLREHGVRSAVLSPEKAEAYCAQYAVKGVILSGGDASVTDARRPLVPTKLLETDVPVLGICLGMQVMASHFGGNVCADRDGRSYGPARIHREGEADDDPLWKGLPRELDVWASHGDSVRAVPATFVPAARNTDTAAIAAMSDVENNRWALQFHPEVTHTTRGAAVFANFVFDICRCERDWNPADMVDEIREQVAREVGTACRTVLGFSGGVDSTTMAAILGPVFGDDLVAVCIDGGHLREGEIDEVRLHARHAGVRLHIVDAEERFQRELGRTLDAEERRRRFKKTYQAILNEQIRAHDAQILVQGTLASDCIESGVAGQSALIKSHHNTGLTFDVDYVLEPLNTIFKHEVRELAATLGLPSSVTNRQPFPGPGLFIRVLGAKPTEQRLDLLRWADGRVRQILEEYDHTGNVDQLVVALDCVPTVGVKGDKRSYGPSVVIRGVETVDFMTAKGHEFPVEIRREIKRRLTAHEGITRVYFNEDDKPPATTELQ